MTYRRWRTVCVEAEVCLDQFESDDLLAELDARGFSVYDPAFENLAAVARALREGRVADAAAIADRLLNPKFRSPEQCQTNYTLALKVPA